MRVVWTPEAQQDRADVWDFIAADNPRAAARMDEIFSDDTILGRMDDVINVAGHRLGTREIEEAVQVHPAIAEVAVVGVAHALKGQMPMAFAVLKDTSLADTAEKRAVLEKEVMKQVDTQLGAIARPGRVHFLTGLPKTRSGKMLRRTSRRWPKAATRAI